MPMMHASNARVVRLPARAACSRGAQGFAVPVCPAVSVAAALHGGAAAALDGRRLPELEHEYSTVCQKAGKARLRLSCCKDFFANPCRAILFFTTCTALEDFAFEKVKLLQHCTKVQRLQLGVDSAENHFFRLNENFEM